MARVPISEDEVDVSGALILSYRRPDEIFRINTGIGRDKLILRYDEVRDDDRITPATFRVVRQFANERDCVPIGWFGTFNDNELREVYPKIEVVKKALRNITENENPIIPPSGNFRTKVSTYDLISCKNNSKSLRICIDRAIHGKRSISANAIRLWSDECLGEYDENKIIDKDD